MPETKTKKKGGKPVTAQQRSAEEARVAKVVVLELKLGVATGRVGERNPDQVFRKRLVAIDLQQVNALLRRGWRQRRARGGPDHLVVLVDVLLQLRRQCS